MPPACVGVRDGCIARGRERIPLHTERTGSARQVMELFGRYLDPVHGEQYNGCPMFVVTVQKWTQETWTAETFLQSPAWAHFKRAYGWQTYVFSVHVRPDANTGGEKHFPLLILCKNIKPFGVFAYAPGAPPYLQDDQIPSRQMARARASLLRELTSALLPFFVRKPFLVRFDPPWGWAAAVCSLPSLASSSTHCAVGTEMELFTRELHACGLRRAACNVQPQDTLLLDMRPAREDIFAAFKPKWRYNVRRAQKHGVRVARFDTLAQEGSPGSLRAAVDVFYALYQKTAARDRIAIHTRQYYRDFCTAFAAQGMLVLCLAYAPRAALRVRIAGKDTPKNIETPHPPASEDRELGCADEQAIAALVLLCFDTCATYVYGASDYSARHLMAPYALQWYAIQEARARGCLWYDFYGIPPTDDVRHPMHGLYRFKTGFGGFVFHRVGSVDMPVRQLHAAAYACAERVRMGWFKRVRRMVCA